MVLKKGNKTKVKAPAVKADLEVISFSTQAEWRKWLHKNHSKCPGIWLRFYKKASETVSIVYAEALDEALCYGWIDGQADSFDEHSYIQRFTPRRPQSMWSKRNIEYIARLEASGKLHEAGKKAAETAKADGRWERAYDSPRNITVPEDFLLALSKNKKALAFFESLNKTNRYAMLWRLQTAKKPETRERRMKIILEMLKKGEKFH